MGLLERLVGLFAPDKGRDVAELARRLDLLPEQLRAVRPAYREFTIPKRSGGARRIAAPEDELKKLQRRILHRLLAKLHCHPAATGFEKRLSIVTNAAVHGGRAVVIRLDLQDFFPSIRAKRVNQYFRAIGWNREAAGLLTGLCTWKGALPQGAPTSPRLSNLINHRLDARLAGLARKLGMVYTRYADDLTLSFDADDAGAIHRAVGLVESIVEAEGYRVHRRRKRHIRRRHQQQLVTGLVVNGGPPRLPRRTRRRLRAIEHHLATGKPATLNPPQLEGWRAFQAMVAKGVG